MAKKGNSKMNIAIIHPDLGIGGAERLVVDAAVQLVSLGHNVHIFTAHHDRDRCFEETISGSFPVTVYGDFLPRHIFYRFHAFCAYLRCIFVALCMMFMWPSFDIILADQVSIVIPVLKLKKSTKVVFYCHFPDLLLAQHSTFLRRIYRKPIDFLEEMTTGMADLILVNSRFTASTFARTFKNINSKGIQPAVLYPAVNVDEFDESNSFMQGTCFYIHWFLFGLSMILGFHLYMKSFYNLFCFHFWCGLFCRLNFLSINRFERKKNIDLAIKAFAMLQTPEDQGLDLAETSLTIAGGFDKRLRENVDYLEELKNLAEKEGVLKQVRFITSCSTAERNALLSQCLCVLYTPKDEHFGIVPLEAMAAQKPVIACNSGGPVETIKNGETGYLCDPTPLEFSLAMAKYIQEPKMAERMGQQARQHVTESFSTRIFGERLNQFLVDVARSTKDQKSS